MRKRVEVSFYKNSLEPRAEEERNHSLPRVEKKGNITSNLVWKSEEVTRSSRTLKPHVEERHSINSSRISNLVWKRKGLLLQNPMSKKWNHKIVKNSRPRAEEDQNINSWKFQTWCGRRKEYQSAQLLRISGGREFELQSSSKISKPCTEQRQNIKYHHYGKFKMSQVTHF